MTSIIFARTRACRSSLNVTLLARTPLEDISTADSSAPSRRLALRLRLDQSVVAHDAQAIDTLQLLKQPQSTTYLSTTYMRHEKAIVQQRADGTTSQLQFLEEVKGADEISFLAGPRAVDDACLPLPSDGPQHWNHWTARHTRQ